MRSSGRRRPRRPGSAVCDAALSSLSRICDAYRVISAAECNSTAEAFNALCCSVPGYTGCLQVGPRFPARPRREDSRWLLLILPVADLEAWRDWRLELLRSPSEPPGSDRAGRGELLLILSSNGNLRVMPDLYAKWVCVVSFHSGASVGAFVDSKKLGKPEADFENLSL